MTIAIIVCAGEQTRWRNHLGVRKQLIEIDGERLLDRTVRLARAHGARRVYVVSKPGDVAYESPGADRVDAHLEPVFADADKFLSSRQLWSASERTVILYGDVWFSNPAMAAIMSGGDLDWTLYCRPGPSYITGATSGECFAIGFYPQHRAEFETALRRVARLHADGTLKRCGGWETYRAMTGVPDNRLYSHRMYRRYVAIDDYTEDFDYPVDYDMWSARRSRTVSVVVPWRPDGGHRDANWAWLQKRWRAIHPGWQIVTGVPGQGPWRKADAVAAALKVATGAFLVLADADVWCDQIGACVEGVAAGAPWGMPHGLVHRLTEPATAAVLDGAPFGGPLEQPPYSGVPGGGMVVVARETYADVPLDARFAGWGSEDDAWGIALTTLAGRPWRGTAPLWHLWHPPQPRLNRRVGSAASHALLVRYQYARSDRDQMRDLLDESTAS